MKTEKFGLRREARRHAAFDCHSRIRKAVSPLRSATAVQNFAALLLCALVLIPFASPAATNDLTGALQQGLFEEEANHNLDAAAQAYQNVAAQFDKDRKLAATAIFRLGEVYRKQGKTNEATAQYERIVREFSDQQTLATLSRQNLTGLSGRVAPSSFSPETPAGSPVAYAEQEALLAQKSALLTRLKKLDSDTLWQVLPTIVSDPVLQEASKQLNAAQQKMAMIKKDYDPNHPAFIREQAVLETTLKQVRDLCAATLKSLEIQVASLEEALDAVKSSRGVDMARKGATDDEEKEIRRIRALIQNSPDLINAPGSGGNTPLHQAANAGQLTVARFLLDNGANVNSRTSSAETALTLAAVRGHRAMVELLLARGAEVNAAGGAGYTALHQTALFNFKAVAETLLASKANVHAPSADGRTPLHLAAGAGHTPLVELLLAHGAKASAVDDKGQSPLAHAAAGGHAAAAKALLAAGAEPDAQNASGRTALSFAARKGSLDAVKVLLAAKADPNAGRIDLPLAWAVYNDNGGEIAELLLQAGADPNLARNFSIYVKAPDDNSAYPRSSSYGPYTPLQIAVVRNQVKLPGLFFKFKADPNTVVPWFSPVRPLIGYAINDVEMFRAFLEAGADPDALHRYGEPLLVAAAELDYERTELLLKHGAKVNVRGNDDRTPLHAAARKNDKKIVALLLAAKADVAAVNKLGQTALRLAVNNGAEEIAELLLSSGADVNQKDGGGDTPLHWAVSYRQKEICELFLKRGAEPNAQNNQSQTPLDYAKEQAARPAPPFGVVPPPPGASPQNTRSYATPAELIALLKQHGALDDLPDFSKIRITRAGVETPQVVFLKGTNDWNRFTLLDLLFSKYFNGNLNPLQVRPDGQPITLAARLAAASSANNPAFPDLRRIVITRANSKTGAPDKRIMVDLILATGEVDCAKDVPLEFGDVVEIAEREHTLQEPAIGLTAVELRQVAECRGGAASLLVRGKKTELKVWPYGNEALLPRVLARSEVRSALFSSSDLSHIKVTRRDPTSGKRREFIVDCSGGKSPDLWLRDGDVIEVPDKP